ncbi:MAG TPA: class I SAM-dependent methyltransferase [Bryobacteraceae bacterium]|jgi:SAM-dependent methyltransferase|nr:class I SAM-dependent methyltransferase [Bryobacteraceae bacterium]
MDHPAAVVDHYSAHGLAARVESVLRQAGLENARWSDFAPLDQFHVRGLAATEELAKGLNIKAGSRLLDVGSGLGGPSRYLAATYGCHVTGVDLSGPFIEVARMLASKAGLSNRVSFLQEDALNLPFAGDSFDYAWTQHVAMNIHDRLRLYSEIHRVLGPDGLLAIYDVIAGGQSPLIFPVPWAREPEISFLLSDEEMRRALEKVGFDVVSWNDSTEARLAWLSLQQAERRTGSAQPLLGLHVVMGPEFPEMTSNLGRNLADGRARLLQAIVRKAGN